MPAPRPFSLNPKARPFVEGQRRAEAETRAIALNALFPASTRLPDEMASLLARIDDA